MSQLPIFHRPTSVHEVVELSRKTKRYHMNAISAARLAKKGYTHREIAFVVGRKPEQIKTLILLGERLVQLEKEER